MNRRSTGAVAPQGTPRTSDVMVKVGDGDDEVVVVVMVVVVVLVVMMMVVVVVVLRW